LTGADAWSRPDPGLQPERTALAWARTSFAVLANGILLMLKNFHGPAGPLRLVAAGLAVAFAISVYLIGVRRQTTLGRRPLPRHITPRREVYVVGTAVLVLIAVSALALLV
jgi:uncharacterized membrane protein YidH (DUF202 family)